MKSNLNCLKMKQLGFMTMVGFIFVAFTQIAIADDDAIDDVESDMDAALADSDAAQTEAVDAKKREIEEKARLERAKEEASNAVARAKTKEISAKGEIGDLEGKTNEARKERERYEKQKTDAEKKIAAAEARIAEKKMLLEKVRIERNAGRDEKDAQLMVLSRKVNEQKELEKQIAADRNETQELVHEITKLKQKTQQMELKLKKMRENGLKVAAYKQKMKDRRDVAKRNISSVPQNITFKPAVKNCDVAPEAKDGLNSVGHLMKGKKYELHDEANERWIEVQVGRKKGYVLRTCF